MSGQRSIGKDDDEWPACYDGVQDAGKLALQAIFCVYADLTACPNMTLHV